MKGNTMKGKVSHNQDLPGGDFRKLREKSESGQKGAYHFMKCTIGLILISLIFSSCVSKKILLSEQDKSAKCFENLAECQANFDDMNQRNRELANMI
ncbi:MAG: hypothetical protein AMS23_05735, partial [Bacteroides sp. SM1_62]